MLWQFLIQNIIMKIDKLILGTAQMGLDYGVNNLLGKIKKEDRFKILEKAFNSGIRILDSSEKYGNAHQIIGDFHSIFPKIKYKIITKIPPFEKIDNINLKIDEYLLNLKIDQIYCLMFHSFDSYINNKQIYDDY